MRAGKGFVNTTIAMLKLINCLIVIISLFFLLFSCTKDQENLNIINYTIEENRVLDERSMIGFLSIKLLDETTGSPINECVYDGYNFSLDKDLVEKKALVLVSWYETNISPNGVHEFKLCQGYYILILSADGYWPKKTQKFSISEGKTTKMTLRMEPSTKIRIIVHDEDGSLLPDGKLLLKSIKPKARLIGEIKNGIVEMDFNHEDITIIVCKDYLPSYQYQSITKELTRGKLEEINIRLVKE